MAFYLKKHQRKMKYMAGKGKKPQTTGIAQKSLFSQGFGIMVIGKNIKSAIIFNSHNF